MARRTRGGPKVVWLPGDPFFAIDSAGLGHSTINFATETLTQATIGQTQSIIAPVVRDGLQNPLTATSSLADITQSGYRLRRIVGKMWVEAVFNNGADDGASAACTAGFIVLRTDDQGLPLSAAANDTYNASIIENQADPWIWRRTWLVSNASSSSANGNPPFANGQFLQNSPYSNQWLGGNMDGPHIDAKTARIVGPEERLFLVLSSTGLGIGDPQTPLVIHWVWETRVLASMRTMVGNRRNASR